MISGQDGSVAACSYFSYYKAKYTNRVALVHKRRLPLLYLYSQPQQLVTWKVV